jgi:hypothetical protein
VQDSPVEDPTTTSSEIRLDEPDGPSSETRVTPSDTPAETPSGWLAGVIESGSPPEEPPGPRPGEDTPSPAPVRRARARMHPVTLRFRQPLESEFVAEYFRRTRTHLRVALVLGFLLYATFGVLDTWIAPDQRRQLWIIRYCVVCPLMLVCLVGTYERGFRRVRQPAITFALIVAGLGIAVMTAIIPPPGSYLYYAGLLLVIACAFTLVPLTLPYATAASAATMLAYIAVATWWNQTSGHIVANNMFFLTSAAIIGFSANYTMERYARINFLQRRVIHRRTRELEASNSELVV